MKWKKIGLSPASKFSASDASFYLKLKKNDVGFYSPQAQFYFRRQLTVVGCDRF